MVGVVDWAFAHRAWEKWINNSIGSSGEPLKAALLLNYDPKSPSRLMPLIAEQQGIKATPDELRPFLDFVKRNNWKNEFFYIGANELTVSAIIDLIKK